MKQLFVDNYTFLRIAEGIQARQNALENGRTVEQANESFMFRTRMDYGPDTTMSALEEHPNLLQVLIPLLSADVNLKTMKNLKGFKYTQEEIDEATTARDSLWEKYEIIRRMTAFDLRSLIVTKS